MQDESKHRNIILFGSEVGNSTSKSHIEKSRMMSSYVWLESSSRPGFYWKPAFIHLRGVARLLARSQMAGLSIQASSKPDRLLSSMHT
jgi:hypothetical protein